MASFSTTGRKIVAIGRNYALHIKELGNSAPTEPFFFLKPTTSYVPTGGKIEIPRGIDVHYEVELGVVIGQRGRDISQKSALSFVSGYALGIDMTARNMQEVVKKKGLPWSAVKGFDTFTPIRQINGQTKQDGNTADMIFRIPRLIEHVSSIMTLEEGDLLLTGTPSGVGPIVAGDKVSAGLATSDGKLLAELELDAIAREGGYHFTS